MKFSAHIFDPATGDLISRKVVTSARDPFVALEQAGRGVCRDDLGDDWQDWRMVRDPDPEIGWRPVRRPEAELAAKRLEAARAAALARLPAVLDAAAAPLIARYPAAERLGWGQKEEAARAVIAGQPAAPIIAAEAAALGATPDVLARKVAAKAATFRAAVAVLSARREATEAAIAAATTPEEIAAALDAAGAPLATQTGRN